MYVLIEEGGISWPRKQSNRRTAGRPAPARRVVRKPGYRVARLDYRSSGYFERTPTESDTHLTIPPWLPKAIGVAVVVGFVIWFFTAAPWLQVKHIAIEGQATEEVKAEINKLYGKNILWLSVTSPDRIIREKQPSIKQIQILRGIPDTLRVKLIEREPALIWQVGENWYTLDPTGFVFREQKLHKKEDGSLDYPGTDLPVVVDTATIPTKVGQIIVRPQFIAFVTELKNRLPKEYNVNFVRAEIGETSFNVTAVTDAGWSILFDTTRKLDPQLRTLARVLETKRAEVREYVDVRVRGWVYYK